MYHSISRLPSENETPYDNVSPELFKAHMRILRSSGFHTLKLQHLLEKIRTGHDVPPKSVVITFDDGYKNNYLYAFPVLRELGFSAAFFLIAGAIGQQKPFEHLLWDGPARAHFQMYPESRLPLDWKEVRELEDCDMEIGSHGLTHRSLGHLNIASARREIIQSKKVLEKELSNKVRHFSYPFGSRAYGDYDVHTRHILMDAGYLSACTTEIGPVLSGDSTYELKRIPIRETDTPTHFRQKIEGAFDWVQQCKSQFQKRVKRIDQVMWQPVESGRGEK